VHGFDSTHSDCLEIAMRIDRADAKCPRGAFTLVEILVAMCVIGISVVALYGAISSSYDTIRFARENLRATQILTEKSEALRLYDWEQITMPGFIPTSFATPFDPVNTNAPGPTYNGTIKIKKIPNSLSYADDLRRVNIELTWNSRGRTRYREFSTYVCRTGIQNYKY
jgi:prepilin-type N-terminal cleavage/methylation domain-containing protein